MAEHDAAEKISAPRRMEILTGGGERQRWPDAMKAKIVVESYAPGVVVTELARRYGALASQVHAWRKAAREGRLLLPSEPKPGFAQIVVAPAPPAPRPATSTDAKSAAIEITADGVHVRIRGDADPALVSAIVRALKSAS